MPTDKDKTRANVRKETRGRRDEIRTDAAKKRPAVRAKERGAAAAVMLLAALTLAAACNTATPSSKAMTSRACGNTVTLNLNLQVATNAAETVLLPGGITVTLSDVIGTQVQSADAGRDDAATQTATPTMQTGLTGDKAIEETAGLAKTALTGGAADGGDALAGLIRQARQYLASGGGATSAAVAAAAAALTNACPDGACATPK